MSQTITVDGDEVIDATIDGEAVEEITIDGVLAWAAEVGLDGLTVTRQDGSYTASSGEHVVSNGGTITLPSPVQDGIVMVTKVKTRPELTGTVDGISDPYISGDESAVFVSDGNEWYSVDRNQISAIPDSGLFLDDFEDEKLSSRDDYSTTELTPADLEPNSSAFANPTRPEWTVDNGSLSFTNGVLEVSTGDRIYTDFTASNILNNDTTWEMAVQNKGNDNSVSSSSWIGLIANNTFSGSWDNPSDGYWVQINNKVNSTSNSSGLSLMHENDTQVINTTQSIDTLNNKVYIKVTRSSGGDWEMFVTTSLPFDSSDSIGTHSEASEPNYQYHSIGARNDFSPAMDVHYILIY